MSVPLGMGACTKNKCEKQIQILLHHIYLLFHTKCVRIDYVDQGSIGCCQIGFFLGIRSAQSPGDHISVVISVREALNLLSQGKILKQIK